MTYSDLAGCGGNDEKRALVPVDGLAWSVPQEQKSRTAVPNDKF